MSRVGKLLIAHPNLPKGNPFKQSVIYVYEDNANGTVGVVLNFHSNSTVSELCNQKGIIFPDQSHNLHKGGPVNEQAILMLHTNEWQSHNTSAAGPGLNITSDNIMFNKIALGDQPAYYRIFAGMAAWQPGQLDMELKGQFPYKPENSWLLADANDSIIFEYDGDKQWQKAVELSSSQMIEQYF